MKKTISTLLILFSSLGFAGGVKCFQTSIDGSGFSYEFQFRGESIPQLALLIQKEANGIYSEKATYTCKLVYHKRIECFTKNNDYSRVRFESQIDGQKASLVEQTILGDDIILNMECNP
jgi:hypothetical protein